MSRAPLRRTAKPDDRTDGGLVAPDRPQSSGVWPWGVSVILAALLGAAFGFLAKMADARDFLGSSQITSMLGVWVVVVAFVGFRSVTLARAAACSTLFVLAALFTYYVRQWQEFGYVPRQLTAAWGLLAVTGVPALASVCSQVWRRGWPAALAVGLPMSLVVAEGLPRLIAAPVIQPYVWADIVWFVVLAVFGLVKRISVWRLAAVVAAAALISILLLDSVWSTIGGLS